MKKYTKDKKDKMFPSSDEHHEGIIMSRPKLFHAGTTANRRRDSLLWQQNTTRYSDVSVAHPILTNQIERRNFRHLRRRSTTTRLDLEEISQRYNTMVADGILRKADRFKSPRTHRATSSKRDISHAFNESRTSVKNKVEQNVFYENEISVKNMTHSKSFRHSRTDVKEHREQPNYGCGLDDAIKSRVSNHTDTRDRYQYRLNPNKEEVSPDVLNDKSNPNDIINNGSDRYKIVPPAKPLRVGGYQFYDQATRGIYVERFSSDDHEIDSKHNQTKIVKERTLVALSGSESGSDSGSNEDFCHYDLYTDTIKQTADISNTQNTTTIKPTSKPLNHFADKIGIGETLKGADNSNRRLGDQIDVNGANGFVRHVIAERNVDSIGKNINGRHETYYNKQNSRPGLTAYSTNTPHIQNDAHSGFRHSREQRGHCSVENKNRYNYSNAISDEEFECSINAERKQEIKLHTNEGSVNYNYYSRHHLSRSIPRESRKSNGFVGGESNNHHGDLTHGKTGRRNNGDFVRSTKGNGMYAVQEEIEATDKGKRSDSTRANKVHVNKETRPVGDGNGDKRNIETLQHNSIANQFRKQGEGVYQSPDKAAMGKSKNIHSSQQIQISSNDASDERELVQTTTKGDKARSIRATSSFPSHSKSFVSSTTADNSNTTHRLNKVTRVNNTTKDQPSLTKLEGDRDCVTLDISTAGKSVTNSKGKHSNTESCCDSNSYDTHIVKRDGLRTVDTHDSQQDKDHSVTSSAIKILNGEHRQDSSKFQTVRADSKTRMATPRELQSLSAKRQIPRLFQSEIQARADHRVLNKNHHYRDNMSENGRHYNEDNYDEEEGIINDDNYLYVENESDEDNIDIDRDRNGQAQFLIRKKSNMNRQKSDYSVYANGHEPGVMTSESSDVVEKDVYVFYIQTDDGDFIGPLRFDVEDIQIGLEGINTEDSQRIANEGLRNRQTGSHGLNEFSSRSHSVLTVTIDSETQAEGEDDNLYITKRGKLSFVDLAGSEKVKDATIASGSGMTESNSINKSLLVLGNCISHLGDPKRRQGHIPYRDSKLTKLLADSLGGNGITLMVACITPSSSNTTETLNTLRYASRAKKIKTRATVKMDPREKLIVTLKKEIKILRNENHYLRQQLDFPSKPKGQLQKENDEKFMKFMKETQQKESGLYEMLQEYMVENETLRAENMEMQGSKDTTRRDQQQLHKENERLVRRVEELERAISEHPSNWALMDHHRRTDGYSQKDLSPRGSPVNVGYFNAQKPSIRPTDLPMGGANRKVGSPHGQPKKPPHRLQDHVTRPAPRPIDYVEEGYANNGYMSPRQTSLTSVKQGHGSPRPQVDSRKASQISHTDVIRANNEKLKQDLLHLEGEIQQHARIAQSNQQQMSKFMR